MDVPVLVRVFYFFMFIFCTLMALCGCSCLPARVSRLSSVYFSAWGGIRRHDFQFPDARFQPFDFWNRWGERTGEEKKIKSRLCSAHPGTQDNKPSQTVKQNSHHYGKETSEYPKSRGKCMNIECWFFSDSFHPPPRLIFFLFPPHPTLQRFA